MTSKLGRSVLDLDVDDSRLVAGLDTGRRRAQKFTDDVGRTIRDAGRAIGGVGNFMTTGLTVPLVAAGAAVTKIGLDFETTLKQVVGLTDVTGDQLDGIREKILALGPAVGKGPQELAEAFYFVASAGFEADEAMEVLEISARAAASGLGETQTVAQVLGGVINAYGKENITAARAADILTEAISQGTAEAPAFAGVIGRVVPAAAAMGVTFDQVAAALAGMTLTGLSAEEAAVGLNQVFISLLKPTTAAEEAMKGLGLSSGELRRQLREEGLLATLRTLEERFEGNETASAAVFGNVRALRTVTSLLTLDAEQLNGVFAKVEDSQGRAATAFEETEGPARRLDRAMATMQATAIDLSEDVIPLVVELLDQVALAVKGAANWWRSLDKDTRRAIVQFLAFVAVTGPVLIIVGKLVTGLGALLTVTRFLVAAQGLPRLIALIPAIGPAVAKSLGPLAALVAALVALREVGSGIGEVVNPKKDLPPAGRAFWDVMRGRVGLFSDEVQAAIDATRRMTPALEESGRDWEEYQRSISFDPLIRELDEAATQSMLIAAGIPPEIASQLTAGQEEIGGAADEAAAEIAEALAKAKADSVSRIQEMLNDIESLLAAGPDQMQEEIDALTAALIDPYTELERRSDLEVGLAMDGIVANLQSGDLRTEKAAFDQVNNWLAQYDLLAPGALERGELINPAFQEGIDSNLQAMLEWARTNVVGEYMDMYGVSLSTALDAMGYESLAAFARGVERADLIEVHSAAAAARGNLITEFEAGYDEAYSGGYTTGSEFSRGVTNGLAAFDIAMWTKLNSIKKLLGGSLPEIGPLAGDTARRGGASVGGSWTSALAGSIDRALVERSLAGIVDALTPNLGPMVMPSVGASAFDVRSLATGSVGDVGQPNAGTTIIYQLHANGTVRSFDSRDAFMDGLQALSAFGEGRLGG